MSTTPQTDAAKGEACMIAPPADEVVTVEFARQLETELKVAEFKNRTSLANNLCPDHRDKQAGKPCLACTVEKLETDLAASRAEVLALREALHPLADRWNSSPEWHDMHESDSAWGATIKTNVRQCFHAARALASPEGCMLATFLAVVLTIGTIVAIAVLSRA